ncbi:MAG: PAS domain S-box protein [Pseudomonadota bacterium]
MVEDERLREALLELQFLRNRESRSLEQTKLLLDCLEAFTGASSAGDALASIFVSLGQKLGSSLSLMVERVEGDAPCVRACDNPQLLGKRLLPPFDPFTRARNISTLAVLGSWQGDVDTSKLGALIVAPANAELCLLTFRDSGQQFHKDDLGLVTRLSGLAAQALRSSEMAAQNELLAATIESSPSGFAISDATDPNQPLIYVNRAFETISGYSASEVVGENCRVLTAEAEEAPERVRLRSAVRSKTGGKFLLRNRRKSGELFWNELTLSPVQDAKGRVTNLVATQADVTELKEAQILLFQRLAAMEAAPDGIAIEDASGRLTYLNSTGLRLLGFHSEEAAIGQEWRQFYRDAPSLELDHAFEMTLQLANGHDAAVHEITGSPLESGGVVLVIRDVTSNLKTEAREQELTRELLRLQRQEAIAQLTAGIAHDFNNLLSAINGSATLIGMVERLPQEARPHLDRISAAGTQSTALISRLLDVGAGDAVEGAFDISDALADVPSLVQASLSTNVSLQMPSDVPLLTLQGAPGPLTHILINLVLNACDAIGNAGGTVSLDAQAHRAGTDKDLQSGTLIAGATYARVSVSDAGSGMAPATVARAFEPYFTTKGRQGTGLGLATAALQLRAVGGGIDVETAPGQGSVFTLYWPLAKDIMDKPQVLHLRDLSRATILVVDDDRRVAEVVSSYLEALGAEVSCCEDPRDAAAAIIDDPEGWSAMVTDYDMPHLDGGGLVAAVGDAAPNLPIIIMTALAKRLSDPRLERKQVQTILPKPVDLEHLARALAAAVNGG